MMKRIAAGLIGVGAAVTIGAGVAHADLTAQEQFAVDDSYGATCHVIDENFTGAVLHDAQVLLGVSRAVGNHYGFSGPTQKSAGRVVIAQVLTYCPEHWGELMHVIETVDAASSASSGPARDPVTGRYNDGDGEGCFDGQHKTSADSGITYTCSGGQWHEGPTLIPLR